MQKGSNGRLVEGAFGLAKGDRIGDLSLPSAGRATSGEFLQFLGIARGSNFELESQFVIARGLKFGTLPALEEAEKLCDEVGRLLSLLSKSLRTRAAESKRPR